MEKSVQRFTIRVKFFGLSGANKKNPLETRENLEAPKGIFA